ncbi:hypothetical protein EON83_02645 [bacterium]|nr:MAG: hypothetical protein EON83_02645 [bacterium]
MKVTSILPLVAVSALAMSAASNQSPAVAAPKSQKVEVGAYYFPGYHSEPRMDTYHPANWNEWQLMKDAKPRYPGHQQPKVPLWGYEDESDIKAMEKKIQAAADYNVDAFIFDWYDYDGPFLEKPLNQAFLKAKNRNKVKFALMWANHDWLNIMPRRAGEPEPLIFPGKVTNESFDRICDHVIKDYFSQPNYWKINGKPYFSIYDLGKLLESFGTTEATKAAFNRFRAKTIAAGFPGLDLNVVLWGNYVLPGESEPARYSRLVKVLGIDSATSYVWIHYAGMPTLETPYNDVFDRYIGAWDKIRDDISVPYYPNVSIGWDQSPRMAQDQEYSRFGVNTIGGNTPERFEEALRFTKNRLLQDPNGPRVITINSWNEWTEGSYLEPDTINKFGYLKAVKNVFGK